MKITCDRKLFQAQFAKASTVCPKRSPKEVLNYVYLQVTDHISLLANGLESGICVTVDGQIDSPGNALLHGDLCHKILRDCPSEYITLEITPEGKLVATAGKSEFNLPVQATSEYPIPEFSHDGESISFNSSELKTAIDRTVFCTDESSSRFALGGIMVDAGSDGLANCIGTDGRRLSSTSVVTQGSLGGTVLIPAKAARALSSLIQGDDDSAMLWANGSRPVVYSDENIQFCALQTEGRFPNWKQVIPDLSEFEKFEVDADTLCGCVRQASITCDIESKRINLEFGIGGLTLASSSQDMGSATIGMDLPCNISAKVFLDSSFLVQYLRTVATKKVEMFVSTQKAKPVVFNLGDEYMHLIMSMGET